jgi:hypothetical protein
MPNQPMTRALPPKLRDKRRIGNGTVGKRRVRCDRADFEAGLVGGPDNQWPLNHIFRCRIPDGDAQAVAILRVAQDGRLLGRCAMRFTDRVA